MQSISDCEKNSSRRLNQRLVQFLLASVCLAALLVGLVAILDEPTKTSLKNEANETVSTDIRIEYSTSNQTTTSLESTGTNPLDSKEISNQTGTVVIDKGDLIDKFNLIFSINDRFRGILNFTLHRLQFISDHIGIQLDDNDYDVDLLMQLEKTTKYWFDEAQSTLKQRLYNKLNTNIAKNILYFVGDGMSLTTLTATRIFQGQLQGKRGEETDLWFQKFPNVGLAKVIRDNKN